MSSSNAQDPEDTLPVDKVDPYGKGGADASLESGLWNLDDDAPSDPRPLKTSRSSAEIIPSANPARAQRVISSSDSETSPPIIQTFEGPLASRGRTDKPVRLNPQQQKDSSWQAAPASKLANFPHEFDDLEQWVDDGGNATGKEMEDAAKLAEIDAAPSVEKAEAVANEIPDQVVQSAAPEPKSEPPRQATGLEAHRQKSNYSMLEKMGMIALIIALLAVFAGFLTYTATRLPMESLDSRKVKFPISGQHVSVRTATSYWRDVVESGPQADVVRRGTRMVPVLELSCGGGPGVLRVLFRDENGDSVGDAITRRVTEEENITVVATAGFNDFGMHAAYRTGESKPWKVEVYEGSGTNVSDEGFAQLFEMDISAERR